MKENITGYNFFIGFLSGLYNCQKSECGDIFMIIKNKFFESGSIDKDYLIHACVTFIQDYLHIDSYVTRYGATFDIKNNVVCVITTDKPSDYKTKMSFTIENFRNVEIATIRLKADDEEIYLHHWNKNYLNSLINVLAGIIESEHAKNILKIVA